MAGRELFILLVVSLLRFNDAFNPRRCLNTALIQTNAVSPFQEEQQKSPKLMPAEKEEIDLAYALDAVLSESTTVDFSKKRQYNWKEFWPKKGLTKKLRWLITGAAPHFVKSTDAELKQNWGSLARMLILLEEYEARFGLPQFGGPEEQRKILRDLVKDLYGSGAPTWVLEAVMARIAEGLTGKQWVQLLLLPNRAFIYYPASDGASACTELFRSTAGFNIAKLGALEAVVVRLASFAGNTNSAERQDHRYLRTPQKHELVTIKEEELKVVAELLDNKRPTEIELAKYILDLAAESYGLFYFLNSPKFQEAAKSLGDEHGPFWQVNDSTINVFSRLAARESYATLQTIQSQEKRLYKPPVMALFGFLSSAGACALWFGGGWPDMFVSGTLSLLVGYLGTKRVLAFEERVLTEVVSSFVVGVVGGLLAIRWPTTFSFEAIAMASVLNLLQGFKVVFAVIEVMAKNVVTGTARLLEGILYTGLLSYSMKFGLDIAVTLLSGPQAPLLNMEKFLSPTNPISTWFFPLILPLATAGWSGLFHPSIKDLPLMAFHGMLVMCLNWAGLNSFLSAMSLTLSAGLISRFTGREALGNTFAGLYALTPGAYMAKALLLETSKVGFWENVLVSAVTIGLGAWAGTILCSPTILGKTSGLHGFAFKRNSGDTKKASMLRF